jgi:hypothetical protein
MEQGVSALWMEQESETDKFDSSPRLSDLPLGTDQYSNDVVAPSDEAPLFWLQRRLVNDFRDVRRVVATTANQIRTGRPTQEFNYPSIGALATKSPHRGPANPETLQHLWGIGHETAARTIGTTTQPKYTSTQKNTCAQVCHREWRRHCLLASPYFTR